MIANAEIVNNITIKNWVASGPLFTEREETVLEEKPGI